VALLGASGAAAGDWEARTGYYFDVEDVFVGVGYLTDLGSWERWYFNPNFEYVFVSDGDLMTLNLDAHYDLNPEDEWHFWVGAGPAVLWIDNGDSDTDFGVNLLAGVGKFKGEVRPFAQLKTVLADENEVALALGVRF
jgi:hypothetical protein